MSNPLFNMSGQNGGQMFGPLSNLAALIPKFNTFNALINGDAQLAEQQVKQLLNSGQMTQAQFNELSQAAEAFQQLLKG